MTQHVNLLICIPGLDIRGDTVKALVATFPMLAENGISWAFLNEGSSLVSEARESTLNGGREHNVHDTRPVRGLVTYDKIMWIDSDITFTPDDVLTLWRHDYDIVSGAYLLPHGEVTAYPEAMSRGFMFDEVKAMTEPRRIAGCGFGFVMIRQGVFESLSRPWFQSVTVNSEDGNDEFHILGEDLSFCLRAIDAGYEIWLDPSVKVIHHKTMRLTWDGPRP